MSQASSKRTRDAEAVEPAWRLLCRSGGLAAFVMLVSGAAPMVVVLTLVGEPVTPSQFFTLLGSSRLVALLRMDLASVVTMGLYYFAAFSGSPQDGSFGTYQSSHRRLAASL